MKTVLRIQTSLQGSKGQSSQLADRFVERWLRNNPGGRIVTRDLSRDTVPHLTAERFAAFAAREGERTGDQQAAVALSDALIDELRNADTIVLAVPMYNFSVPSTLRSYFDHIARAGVTFRYTANGAEGLIKGKQAYVFITRGGIYSGAADTQTPYLRQFLGFIGITDVEFIYAEGLAYGNGVGEKNLAAANATIEKLRATEAEAA
jgi:FMN-dependent NADH-azoreductase